MQDAVNERRTTYGLRLRRTGQMLRVEHESDLVGDSDNPSSEITYRLTTDEAYPIYDAGSAERLALVFAYPHRGSAEIPYTGDFKPGDVEQVAIEEIVTRTVKPTGLAFDLPIKMGSAHTIDLNRAMGKHVEGLNDILDVVDLHQREIASQLQAGSTYEWGRHRLVGLIVPGEVDALPEGYQGSIILDPHGNAGRRALTAVPLPGKLTNLLGQPKEAGNAGSLVVCIADPRPAPQGLLDALRELSDVPAPGPR